MSIANEPNLELGHGISFESSIEDKRQNILAFGMFTEIDEVSGDLSSKSNGLSANYHSLTTDSFGVLSDVRTGVKRVI